jgi:hypothetical protein
MPPKRGQRPTEPQLKKSTATPETRKQLGKHAKRAQWQFGGSAADREYLNLTIQLRNLCFALPAGLRRYICTRHSLTMHHKSVPSPYWVQGESLCWVRVSHTASLVAVCSHPAWTMLRAALGTEWRLDRPCITTEKRYILGLGLSDSL